LLQHGPAVARTDGHRQELVRPWRDVAGHRRAAGSIAGSNGPAFDRRSCFTRTVETPSRLKRVNRSNEERQMEEAVHRKRGEFLAEGLVRWSPRVVSGQDQYHIGTATR
jgi:transposase-like protein